MGSGTSRLSAGIQFLVGLFQATPPVLNDGDSSPLMTDINANLRVTGPPNADHGADSTFGLQVWVTGSPVAADAAPVLFSDVPPGRRMKIVPRPGALTVAGGSPAMRVISVGGTSISYVPWYWDDTLAKWVPLNAAQTVTTGALPAIINGLTTFLGAWLYVQIVSQTGGVTAAGYGIG